MIWQMGTVTWGHVFACCIVIKTKEKITKNRSHSEVKVVINNKRRNTLLSEKYQTRFGGHVTYMRVRNDTFMLFIEDSVKTKSEGKKNHNGNNAKMPRAIEKFVSSTSLNMMFLENFLCFFRL